MSILNEEEFQQLRKYKGKVDVKLVEDIINEIEEEYSRSNSVTSSIIFVYANHVDLVKQNKEFFELISKIYQKYSGKIGMENVSQLVINSLK
ncbi:MAG: hypothetical protein RXQ80_08550 [Sulfolobaceae archaeon]|jgi:sulfate adenylyltransferase subunit 1 (EFTu-like GTPase family)|nr:hypothetical protein [Sulfolobaceae archaeon]